MSKQIELNEELLNLNERILTQKLSLKDVLMDATFPAFKGLPIEIQTTFRENGWSGFDFNHSQSNDTHFVRFAPLLSGKYAFHFDGTYNIFDQRGQFEQQTTQLTDTPIHVSLLSFESNCTIVNHIYATLSYDYEQAPQGFAIADRMTSLEWIIRELFKNNSSHFSIPSTKKPRMDTAVELAVQKIIQHEKVYALTYNERKTVRDARLLEIAEIIQVKKRAHHRGSFEYQFVQFLFIQFRRKDIFFARPKSNFLGILYRSTIGAFLWFIKTVKGNIGYSIALAIYGPFTFYFITQPMNPHAMWAVGKVRTQFLETIDSVMNLPLYFKERETVNGQATSSSNETKTFAAASNLLATKLPLSTQLEELDKQDWQDRMSQFKSMQIGYEENLQFSQRMGRLEQMETQLNFALIAESSYSEVTRYQNLIQQTLSKTDQYKFPETYSNYLKGELLRTAEYQLYIWDRLNRYMFDHQYIVLDIAKEQKFVDYYMGRGFIFLKEITKELVEKNKSLKYPSQFKRVEQLAKLYQDKHFEHPELEKRFKKNSILFAQKDASNSIELRNYMKRQWEILYLLQNKAQEASHFGLMTYTWSVRNAIWCLESMHSSKRQELELLKELYSVRAPTSERKKEIESEIKKRIEPLYESLLHIITLEFVSIKNELTTKLGKDTDAQLREGVIERLMQGFRERDSWSKLF